MRVTDGPQLALGYYDPCGQNVVTLEANEADQCVARPQDSRNSANSISQSANLVGSTMKAWYWAGVQTPIATDSTNLLYDIASLMADFHDSITALSDPEEKYDQILKYDSRMRALDTQSTPNLIFTGNPKAPGPQWVRWAKGVASIVQAHKTIMIHRSFLG